MFRMGCFNLTTRGDGHPKMLLHSSKDCILLYQRRFTLRLYLATWQRLSPHSEIDGDLSSLTFWELSLLSLLSLSAFPKNPQLQGGRGRPCLPQQGGPGLPSPARLQGDQLLPRRADVAGSRQCLWGPGGAHIAVAQAAAGGVE